MFHSEDKQEVERVPIPEQGNGDDTRAHRAEHLAQRRKYFPIPGPIPEVREQDLQIRMRDAVMITVRIYSPQPSLVPAGGSPLYVALHEGGWCWGDLTDEEMNCRMFSKDLGAVCVNVDYRLAPENPFPTGVNDCWDTLKWVAENATSLNANPKAGFIVGGASAGGNLTAIMTHLARDEKLDPPLTGQYLCVPSLLTPSMVPEKYKAEYISGKENTNDPVIVNFADQDLYEMIQKAVKMDFSSPLFSPFANPSGQVGLPPAYLQICGMDPLRDEGLIYERVLREEYSIQTKLDLYPGFGHMFWTNFPEMEESTEFVKDTLNGIRWLLEKSGSERA